MSRHRNVRNLDYDEILDDDSAAGEMSPADAEKLDRAVDQIVAVLGSDFAISDIKDAAWHYYFDVEQSTNYLLDQKSRQTERAQSRANDKSGMHTQSPEENTSSAPLRDDPPRPRTPNMNAAVESPAKPLSKIQQLAKARAAAKKAKEQSIQHAPSSDRLAPISGKLPSPIEQGEVEGRLGSCAPDAAVKGPVETAFGQIVNHDEAASSDRATLEERLARIELAKPSAFAHVVLGALSSGASDREYADRGFSCFTDESKKSFKTIEKSFSAPSPDDVVLKAQSASKGLIKSKISNAGKTPEEEARQQKPVKTSNKARLGRSVDAQVRKHISLVVIGHVDAGKSTLFGRLLYDIGNIDERSMQRLRKESDRLQKSSFAFAWAMDSSNEERERGVTMDIASNTFQTKETTFTILDAPGHRDFVPNMIAGASQADFAIIVIDASRGAFESGFDADGQTKEHAILVRSLGIQNLIVAINKLDNIEWSQERFKDIQIQLSTFLNHIGFAENNLAFIPCSGLTGQNVAAALNAEAARWYHGRTLLEEMQATEPTYHDAQGPFRMMVADIQATPNSSSITVLGKLSAGELQIEDSVACMPSKEIANVKALISDDNTEVAFAGDSVTITLSGIDPMYLRVGDILCHPTQMPSNVNTFKAQMVTFQMARPLLSGTSVVLHRGRADMPAVIRKIERQDKTKAGLKTTRHVLGNAQAVMTIEIIHGVIPLEPFSVNKDLGRIILRREGSTVAAGVVIELL